MHGPSINESSHVNKACAQCVTTTAFQEPKGRFWLSHARQCRQAVRKREQRDITSCIISNAKCMREDPLPDNMRDIADS